MLYSESTGGAGASAQETAEEAADLGLWIISEISFGWHWCIKNRFRIWVWNNWMMNISNLILTRHSTAFLLHFISYYVMNKKLQVCKQLAFYLLHISSIVLYMFVYKSTQNN